jgi:hypothetical protein
VARQEPTGLARDHLRRPFSLRDIRRIAAPEPALDPPKGSGGYQPLWLLPALSGAELIVLLEQAGCRRLDSRQDKTEMVGREGALVLVPLVPVVPAEIVGEILIAARLSVIRVLELLDRTP